MQKIVEEKIINDAIEGIQELHTKTESWDKADQKNDPYLNCNAGREFSQNADPRKMRPKRKNFIGAGKKSREKIHQRGAS